MKSLRITEIFYSIQGESLSVGVPTVFIRLTGCPLRCTYCDTAYAFKGGKTQTIDSVIKVVKSYQTRYICVTGGEPLAQLACVDLLDQLCALDYQVSLETSGALPIPPDRSQNLKVVMDLKTPSSGELDKNDWDNLPRLTINDQVKWVIGDRGDYDWAKQVIAQHQLDQKVHCLFSPVNPGLNPTELAEWILADQLNVRLQVQLHKYLWDNQPGK
ncbi:7-carboxy-7-deazaguanine synthase QueE [Gammaproteobacteria bacterium]|nr:7-carboxy-7-deazaguanine synthase QueE [Gammaproteobacteria bacterium]